MMQILNQPWFGSVVGIVGLILAIAGMFSYRAAKIGARPVYFQRVRRLIGKDEQELPKEVVITFDGHPVPRLSASQFILWNSGKASISGSDVVSADPLRLEFDKNDEILKARVVRSTRDVNNSQVACEPKSHIANLTFDFMDPGDGVVVELIHTSSRAFPKILGTIKGIPRGLTNVAKNSKTDIFSRAAQRFPLSRRFLVGMLIFGIAMLLSAVLPKEIFPESWFNAGSSGRSPLEMRRFLSVMLFICGVLYIGLPGTILFGRRRRYPACLDPDTETDETPNKAMEATS